MRDKPVKQKKIKLKIHEINESNDIKFNGVFSYRHLRVFGWIALAIGQVGVILAIFSNAFVDMDFAALSQILSAFNSLMMPLFLFAAFAQLLTTKNGYLRLMLIYGGGTLGICAAFYIVVQHFGFGLLLAVTGDAATAQNSLNSILSLFGSNSFFCFNFFLDLLLCTLFMFFVNYHPTKHFQGNKIYIFRLLAVLPIIYEIVCIIFKILACNNVIKISPYVFPLLTTKPPLAFLIFIAAALFIKLRERHFIKNGKTLEEYKAFLNTNTNKKNVSRFLILSIIITVVLDFILSITLTIVIALIRDTGSVEIEETVESAIREVISIGIGNCVPMIFITPILLFFDYRKTYKDFLPDVIIPAAGVALVVLVYIEGLFQLGTIFFTKAREGGKESGGEVEPVTSSIMFSLIEKGKNALTNLFN